MSVGVRTDWVRMNGSRSQSRSGDGAATKGGIVFRQTAWASWFCVLAVVCGEAAAQTGDGEGYRLGPLEVRGSGSGRTVLAFGAYDFVDDEDPSFAFNWEYRVGHKLLAIGPALGIDVNADAALFGYLGLYGDIAIGPVVVTPVLAAGGYREGESIDLGGVFQFRSALDITYEFEDASRLGLRISHISNAGIHDDNPGVEELFLTFSVPFDF